MLQAGGQDPLGAAHVHGVFDLARGPAPGRDDRRQVHDGVDAGEGVGERRVAHIRLSVVDAGQAALGRHGADVQGDQLLECRDTFGIRPCERRHQAAPQEAVGTRDQQPPGGWRRRGHGGLRAHAGHQPRLAAASRTAAR